MRLQVSVEEAVGRRNGGLFSTLAKAARAAARAEGALLLAGGGAVIPGRNNLEVHMPRQRVVEEKRMITQFVRTRTSCLGVLVNLHHYCFSLAMLFS